MMFWRRARPDLLMIHRYFSPDAPPYASLLREIAGHMVNDGYRVRVVAGRRAHVGGAVEKKQPICEELDGIDVVRVPLVKERRGGGVGRALNTAVFLVIVFVAVVLWRPGVVTFSTMPPVALGAVVRGALGLMGRGGCYIYHCQDLYPEAAVVSGLVCESHPIYRVGRKVEAGNRARAGAIVVLSQDMRATAVRGGAPEARVHVINNFSCMEKRDLGLHRREESRGIRIAFAGNLGRFQGVGDVAVAVERLCKRRGDLEFLFIGEGPARGEVELIQDRKVRVMGYQPPDETFRWLEESDLGLVPLKPGLLDVAYPSKVITYLAAGCGLVVVGEDATELGRTVREFDVGEVAPPGDVEELMAAIDRAAAKAGPDLARRARECHSALFKRRDALERWSKLVGNLQGQCKGGFGRKFRLVERERDC